jgi:hypothetical protein
VEIAVHGAVLTVARRSDLGEMGNWDATVNDQGQELVHWVRNNLEEITGHQFIESNGGGV